MCLIGTLGDRYTPIMVTRGSVETFDVIYLTREGVFHRISKHREAS